MQLFLNIEFRAVGISKSPKLLLVVLLIVKYISLCASLKSLIKQAMVKTSNVIYLFKWCQCVASLVP